MPAPNPPQLLFKLFEFRISIFEYPKMPIGFFKSIIRKFTGKPVDWDELEETLIRADLGVPMSMKILKSLQSREKQVTVNDIIEVTREEVSKILPFDPAPLRPFPAKPKSSSWSASTAPVKPQVRQSSRICSKRRHSTILVAADTFRAAAIEQLGVWSERIGVEMIKGQYNADPAALCYDAYVAADKRNIEFLLCDTAGRLHTKTNLMAELNKVKRTLEKHDATAPHECLLVVDATTGSNALQQAREFHQAVNLTGVIVTKLDGSGKGGVIISIQNELNIPTRFIGTGRNWKTSRRSTQRLSSSRCCEKRQIGLLLFARVNASSPNNALVLLFVLNWLIGFIAQTQVRSRLRKHHAQTANSLKIGGIFDSSINSSIAFIGFILMRRFKELNDPLLTRWCMTLLICFILMFPLMLELMIMNSGQHQAR